MGYFEEARARAKRRKSMWNLFLIPAIVLPFVGLTYFNFKLVNWLHGFFYPGQALFDTSVGIGAVLATVSPLFAALPISMMVGNFIVWSVLPARRVLDKEASNVPGTSFKEAQKDLVKATLFMVPVAYGLAFVGVYLPWYK